MQELYDHTGDDGTDLDKFPLGHVNLAATGPSRAKSASRSLRRALLRERLCTLARRFGAKMNNFQGQKILSGCEYLRELAGGNRA